ncbi:uncharacterized protein LOC135572772 [Oncorhynchus nerka]|uniref:uncharacterized protein LOC135572772 n=1 Tax=Oncorhynchus nerka TaxID=8023 RepID=UPI0031B8858F
MIVDFRKQQREHPPIHIDETVVERVVSFKFLGIHITDKLNWSIHTDSIVKKVQQRLFNLRRLKKFGLSPKALTNFYRCTIESILSGCITAWYGNCSAHKGKALQRVVRSAQRITGGKLPALQDTYTTRCHRKAIKIVKDNNHLSHCLFTPLSSRRLIGCLRYCEPSDPPLHPLRVGHLRRGPRLDCVLPDRSLLPGGVARICLLTTRSHHWRPPGLCSRPSPILAIHQVTWLCHNLTWSLLSLLCR